MLQKSFHQRDACRRFMLCGLLCIALCLGGLPRTAHAYDLLRTVVLTKNVHLRVEPAEQADSLKIMPKGSRVTLLDKEGAWYFVQYEKKYGYVREDLIQLAKIVEQPAPVQDEDAYRVLQRGSRGEDVKRLQQRLTKLGYYLDEIDGVYGRGTEAAVIAFQAYQPIRVTGKADEDMQKLLLEGDARSMPDTNQMPQEETLRYGMTGASVMRLQERLAALGYFKAEINGEYDLATTEAVTLFQTKQDIKADGLAGESTQALLYDKNTSALEGQIDAPKPSQVRWADWENVIRKQCVVGQEATVYDYQAKLAWKVRLQAVGEHLDCEPLTEQDTRVMLRAFGGEESWIPRPVWVILQDGTPYMGSANSMPQEGTTISNNGFDGHSCLHFPRENVSETYAEKNQACLRTGWQQTQAMQ